VRLQVSYEYIACQKENHGVLILSEFAGAAHSLNGSLIVNPWNTAETANAIFQAVEMDGPRREQAWMKLMDYVGRFTASYWVSAILPFFCRIWD
jgi:trehalose 6-phosphate synthase